MWSNENRARYDRSRLRYPSDLTDSRMGACRASDSSGQARRQSPSCQRARGRQRPHVRPQHRLPMARHPEGSAAALDTLRLLRSLGLGRNARAHPRGALREVPGSRRRAKQARPPRSSIARASRAQKKGGLHRPFGLRRRQEDQRQEAPHPGRYAGPADVRHRPCRRRPGPRRGSAADGDLVRRLPVPDAALRRWRLSGAEIQARNPAHPGSRRRSRSSSGQMPRAFVVLPKRWIVERTLAWLGRCRRLARDWECLNRKALAFLRLASIRLMLRKLCNPT